MGCYNKSLNNQSLGKLVNFVSFSYTSGNFEIPMGIVFKCPLLFGILNVFVIAPVV